MELAQQRKMRNGWTKKSRSYVCRTGTLEGRRCTRDGQSGDILSSCSHDNQSCSTPKIMLNGTPKTRTPRRRNQDRMSSLTVHLIKSKPECVCVCVCVHVCVSFCCGSEAQQGGGSTNCFSVICTEKRKSCIRSSPHSLPSLLFLSPAHNVHLRSVAVNKLGCKFWRTCFFAASLWSRRHNLPLLKSKKSPRKRLFLFEAALPQDRN